MTTLPPSPFIESAPVDRPAAASSPPTPVGDAAVDGPDIPLAELMCRGFDPDAFVSDCEPLPEFIRAPSQAYLTATEIEPVLRVIARH